MRCSTVGSGRKVPQREDKVVGVRHCLEPWVDVLPDLGFASRGLGKVCQQLICPLSGRKVLDTLRASTVEITLWRRLCNTSSRFQDFQASHRCVQTLDKYPIDSAFEYASLVHPFCYVHLAAPIVLVSFFCSIIITQYLSTANCNPYPPFPFILSPCVFSTSYLHSRLSVC